MGNSEYWYRCGWPLIHGTAGRSTGSAPADRLAARCVASGGGRGGEGGDVSPTSRAMEKLVDDLTGGGGVTGGVLSSLTDARTKPTAGGPTPHSHGTPSIAEKRNLRNRRNGRKDSIPQQPGRTAEEQRQP